MTEIPTDEMLEAGLDAMDERIEPYTAPRESGVALDMDISVEEAAAMNAETKAACRRLFLAMIEAAPAELKSAFEAVKRGEKG